MHDGLPNICAPERTGLNAVRTDGKSTQCSTEFSRIRSGFAVTLHMHQPLIPAGSSDLKTAEIVSNLNYMMKNQNIGDNHNTPLFH